MNRRTSVYVAGATHRNPIPSACRVGDLVMSSVLNGVDPETGVIAPSLESQCEFLFLQVRAVVTAAGGSMDDIVKMTIWMRDPDRRDILNRAWLAAFPDTQSRPARHTLPLQMEAPRLVQGDFTAVLGRG